MILSVIMYTSFIFPNSNIFVSCTIEHWVFCRCQMNITQLPGVIKPCLIPARSWLIGKDFALYVSYCNGADSLLKWQKKRLDRSFFLFIINQRHATKHGWDWKYRKSLWEQKQNFCSKFYSASELKLAMTQVNLMLYSS